MQSGYNSQSFFSLDEEHLARKEVALCIAIMKLNEHSGFDVYVANIKLIHKHMFEILFRKDTMTYSGGIKSSFLTVKQYSMGRWHWGMQQCDVIFWFQSKHLWCRHDRPPHRQSHKKATQVAPSEKHVVIMIIVQSAAPSCHSLLSACGHPS